MLEYHPSSNHCPPRRSGRSRTYACIAIGKGHLTPAFDRAARNRATVLRAFLLKRLPRKGLIIQAGAHPCLKQGAHLSSP
jgi:hypothetical protein